MNLKNKIKKRKIITKKGTKLHKNTLLKKPYLNLGNPIKISSKTRIQIFCRRSAS
ncbi:hypothetical protein AAHB46_00005 [Bacillus paranthracis]